MEITVKVQVTPENRAQVMKALDLIYDEGPIQDEPIKEETVKEKPTPVEEKPVRAAPVQDNPANKVTVTDVRAIALKYTNAGRSKELKEIMGKYGAVKLSAIPEDKLADVLNDLNTAFGEGE